MSKGCLQIIFWSVNISSSPSGNEGTAVETGFTSVVSEGDPKICSGAS